MVLQTQVDKGSAIRSFSRDLALFSGTLAANDKDLRSLIDNGSATANQLRTFLQQNRVNLGQLINNLVTTGEVTVKHLKGIRQILVIYPYVVAGGFTVAKKGHDGKYDAQFGLVLQQDGPVCKAGYDQSQVRPPQDTKDLPMNTKAGCTDGGKNHRGAEKTPNGRAGTAYRSPVATYDAKTGKVDLGRPGHQCQDRLRRRCRPTLRRRLLEVDAAPAVARRQAGVELACTHQTPGSRIPTSSTMRHQRPASKGRAVLAGVLIPLLVLGLVACGYLAYRLNHLNEEPLNPLSGAPAAPATRSGAGDRGAEQFALRMDDVDGTKFDAYVKGIDSCSPPRRRRRTTQVFDAMEQTYAAAKIKGTGKILLSGVADLDSDSATVLVAHDASRDDHAGQIEHHYRWNVSLVKVDGKWLVDDFNPVN